MASLLLSKSPALSKNWQTWLIIALVVGLLGLGVKSIWIDSTGYLVPADTVPVGANLGSEKFRVVRLNLGQLKTGYLSAAHAPTGFALTTLTQGSLVATANIGRNPPESVQRLVVSNKTQLGSGVHAGVTVAIWSAARLPNNQFDVPKELVGRAVVSKVIKNSAVFGSQNQQVEVLVSPLQTPAVLAAMASDSPIFLVAQQ